jgi:hypothetical protein
MIPTHLQGSLALSGVIDTGRVTATAKPRTCPSCHAPTLAGTDEYGNRADVERQPTTTTGEAVAILTGRRTYTIAEGELVDRDAWRISHRDADTEAAYVEHTCHSPPYPVSDRHTKHRRVTSAPDSPPPF